MAECKNQKFVGKDVVLEFVIGCADTLPQENEWQRIGSMRTKEFNLEWETTDATADDSVGALRENLATFQTLSISGDGVVKIAGGGADALKELVKHIAKPIATGGQPTVWLRMTFPDLTFTAFMLMTSASRSAPFDDVVTYALESSATASDFGLIIEDTPPADAEDPESIELAPATLALTVGQSLTAAAVVLPADSPQSVRYTSSAPSIASVGLVSGEIQANAPGSATITATSAVDSGVTDTMAVTVTLAVESITAAPSPITVAEGSTAQITAAVVPSGAPTGLTYASSNTAVATVNSTGLVTGVDAGTANITITSTARPSVNRVVPVTVTA